MSPTTITFVILGVSVLLFVSNRVPVGIVAIGVALMLWATDVLDLEQALGGFGDPTVLFIAALFVVSEGLDATGVTTWVGQKLIDRAGESRTRLLVLMMLLVAVLTALITVNGSVAALLPVVVVMAVRLRRSPSQLLLPLAFAAHAGSLLVLTGTPVSVIVSEAAADAGVGRFGFFEFGLVGVPLVVATIAIVVLFGERLLPERKARAIPSDFSSHARTLVEQYRLDEALYRLRVRPRSPLIGQARSGLELGEGAGVTLVGVQAAGEGALASSGSVAGDDVLLVRGDAEAVGRLASDRVLGLRSEEDVTGTLFSRQSGLAEVVIPPRSALVGEPVFPGMVTDSGDLVVLAVQRRGEDLGPRETELAVGDTLLLQGTWDGLDENLDDPDVLVVDSPDLVRRQGVPLGPRAKRALVVLAAMVGLLASGAVPPAVAGLAAACAMVLLRVVTVDQAYRAISWTTVVLIGGMIPLSVAMQETGAAGEIADGLLEVVGDAGPYALLAGLFVVTAVFGQLISNTATALIVIPIGISAASELDVSARPVLMSVAVSAAAAFLTPIATPANMMVLGPGGYRFGDYWKLGLPLLLLFGAAAILLVPVFWSF